jgi:imidazolonepropionase-like amidohydrolase
VIRVLTGATLIDGTGAAPVPDAAVVVDGGRVAAAGARGALSWPSDAEVIDVRGRTIIPGLIDAHDHLASHGYGLATRLGLDEPASTAHLRTARVLADTLAMGYTTVRDGGGLDAGFKVAIEQGLIPGPRLVLGIQIVSPTGGIGDPRTSGRSRQTKARERLTALSVDPSSSVFFVPTGPRATLKALRRRGSRARTRLAAP